MDVRGLGIGDPRLRGQRQAQRDADAAAHESRGRGDALGGEVVQRAALIVRSPTPPGAQVAKEGAELGRADGDAIGGAVTS